MGSREKIQQKSPGKRRGFESFRLGSDGLNDRRFRYRGYGVIVPVKVTPENAE
jgi:hypothetical protein